MTLKYILLGLLDEPASGYELKRTFDLSLKHFWAAELSQIYPTLKKMREEGLIIGKTVHSALGPDKKIYARTDKGDSELNQWLSGEPLHGYYRFHYAAQAFFLSELADSAKALHFYQALKAMFETKLNELKEIERLNCGEGDEWLNVLPENEFYPYLTFRMGIHKMSTNIAWCDECISHIEKRMKSK